MHQLVASILCLVFAVLAALHFYWSVGGRLVRQGVVPTVDGRPLFTPGPAASVTVGCVLAAAAVVCALRGGLLSLGLPVWFSRIGVWVLAVVFAMRAIGEFRYVGLFKRVRGTLFARRDSLVYSPLCALIAALAVGLALLAP